MNTSLNKTAIDLLLEYPFYGLLLSELNKRIDPKFPTACVGKHPSSSNIDLVIGEEFWNEVCTTKSLKMGIIIHELEHVIREHIYDMKSYEDKNIANMAMDIAINQVIREDLPRTDKQGRRIGAFLDYYKELNMDANESSQYYYTKLMAAKQQKEESKQKGEDSLNGEPGNKEGTSGCKNFDEDMDGRSSAEHKLWELLNSLSEGEQELIKDDVMNAIKRVAEECKAMGNIPVHLEDIISKDFKIETPVVSWKRLFRMFVGSTISPSLMQSRKRPNPRFEDAPINKQKYKVSIVCGIDSSGSVGEEELIEFFNEVYHMHKAGCNITLVHWDTMVHKVEKYDGQRTVERVCMGGTHASSFIEWVNERKREFTCAICLTDGFIESEPSASKIPLLWVISSDGNTNFKHKSKKLKINDTNRK